MWIVFGIVVVVVLVGLFVLVDPGAPARDFRNRQDAQAGWRSGGQVSWFHDEKHHD